MIGCDCMFDHFIGFLIACVALLVVNPTIIIRLGLLFEICCSVGDYQVAVSNFLILYLNVLL